ncbi:hypothetical protein [Novosphingobium sp.]|uniref:hypothetical protein n=1 Tax=Novosphingobium sp. TaxID=1874826 RepID=UPI002FDD1F5A
MTIKINAFAIVMPLAFATVPALAADVPAAATTTTTTTVAPAATTSIVLPATASDVLRAGAEVPLVTAEDLTTKGKALRVGQRVQMTVAANVEQGGVVVIPSGSPAVAEITEVRNKGMWGKSGYIAARAVSVRVADRSIRLTGAFNDKGVTGTGGVVAAVAFVPVAGFFTTGTSAHIPMGAAVKAFLDEDVSFKR